MSDSAVKLLVVVNVTLLLALLAWWGYVLWAMYRATRHLRKRR